MGEPLNNQSLVKNSKTGISLQSQSYDSELYLQTAYPHKTRAAESSIVYCIRLIPETRRTITTKKLAPSAAVSRLSLKISSSELNEVMIMFAHEVRLDPTPVWKAGLEQVSCLDLILELYQNAPLAETVCCGEGGRAKQRDPDINKWKISITDQNYVYELAGWKSLTFLWACPTGMFAADNPSCHWLGQKTQD